jgi:hypothetical protein
MLHDLLASLTPEQVDFLQTKVAELKTIKDRERFKRTLTQTARTLKIPELVCLLMLEELALFKAAIHAYKTPAERADFFNKMAQYRSHNNSNILFESLYADNSAVTTKVIELFSRLDRVRAVGQEKDAEGRGLVAHCLLSGKRDLLPRVEAILGRDEYKKQLDALSEEQTISLFKNGSDALRADLIDRIKAMNINGFRVDQILSEQGINYYLNLDAPFPPSLESINASEVRNTAEFFTPEAYRLFTQDLIGMTPEGVLYYPGTLLHIFNTRDSDFLGWVLQSNEFQEIAATRENRLIKTAIDTGRPEVALVLLRASSVISTAGDNNNELLKLAMNRGNVALVRALLEIPAVLNNIDISLMQEQNGEEINALLIPHVKWYGQPLNLIVTPEVYELVATGLQFDTANMRNRMRDLDSFIRSFRPQSPFTNTNLKIMRLLESHEKVKAMHVNDANDSETSMGARAQQAARLGYESAQALYGEAFRSHANGLQGIEARIRGMILDEILSDSFETPLTPAQREFIDKKRAEILQGNDKDLMDQVRAQFGSNTNPNHIAWRAYDKFAPVTQWENLLTHEYNLDYRTRVAHYFLGLIDPIYQAKSDMTFEDRRGVFIGTIAEIRRAHNEHNPGEGVDNPSCGRGTIGRIQKMGAGHEVLQMVDPVELLPEIITRILSERLTARLENETDEVKAKFALALAFLNEINIPEIVRNNDIAFEDILDNQIPVSELIAIHEQIIDMLGIDREADYPFHNSLLGEINNDLRQRNQPRVRLLTNEEVPFIRRQVYDLCFNQVGEKISNRIGQALKPDMELVNPEDPYKLAELEAELELIEKRDRNPKFKEMEVRNKNRQISKSKEKIVYFNTVFARLRGDSQLAIMPLEVRAFLAKNMVEKACNSDDFDANDPRFTLEHLKAAYESLREFKQFQVIPFLEEDASARNEVIAEIDDKGKGKEEEDTPKSIVHGFNHLRLSSSSGHANVAGSSSSASMRLA